MIDLINNGERRRLQFAEILTSRKDWVTLADLGNALNCSDRVLKDDITYFKKNFVDFKVETSHLGVRLIFQQDKGLKSLYQKILSESTPYLLLEIIFLYEDKSISELADMLFISASTLYRTVDQINNKITVYDFRIETSPCRVMGNEENIRYFYYQYFFEKYSHLAWPYETIDEKALDKLLSFFIEFTQIPADFAFYNIFKSVSAVNLIRYMNGHYVDTKDIVINFDEIIPDLSTYADDFKYFEEALQIKVDAELVNQIFTPYIQEGFSLSVERLMEKTKVNKKVADEISFLDTMLTKISEETNVAIVNKEELIIALHNSAHLEYQEPQSGYVLYNRNQYFVDALKEEFPQFYRPVYEAIKSYREFIGKPDKENGINFFIYTLFIFWKNLVPELRKQFTDIRVLVISDRHVSHARMLKDFINYEFTDQLVIDIYTSMDLDENILEALDCDFIVANFPLPELETKCSVYIESVPSYNDLVKIQNVIDDIINERLHT